MTTATADLQAIRRRFQEPRYATYPGLVHADMQALLQALDELARAAELAVPILAVLPAPEAQRAHRRLTQALEATR